MSKIDAFIVENQNWLTYGAVQELAILNMLSHEVRPDGTGFVDHPNDPGGATNFGISLRFLREAEPIDGDYDGDGDIDADDIRALSIEDARKLYIEHFWRPHGIDQLPPRLAVKVFDMAVNMGPVQAIKILQRTLNILNDADLEVDGQIGAKTLEAAQFFSNHWHMEKAMDQLREQLKGFYIDLAKVNPKFQSFINGWIRRAVT